MQKCCFPKSDRRGFSLAEVMVTLFILALVMVIASNSFLHLAPKYKLLSAVREIYSRLNYVRYMAIVEGTKIRVRFISYSYIIEKYNESEELWKKEMEYWLDGVTLEANNSPVFHPQGTVSNLASIYIFNSWGKYRISLSISGRIKALQLQP